MKCLGSCVFHKLDAFLSWFDALTYEQASEVRNTIQSKLPIPKIGIQIDHDDYFIRDRCGAMYSVACWSSYPVEQSLAYKWPRQKTAIASELREFAQMSDLYDMPIRVGFWSEDFAYIYLGNPQKGYVIPFPEQYMTYTPEKDYDCLTPAQVRQALNVPQMDEALSIVPAHLENAMTANDVRAQKSEQEQVIAAVKQQLDDARQCKTGELATLQAEIRKKEQELQEKKAALMAELNSKLEELETMKYNLENQIFMLQSQIYAIRCFSGEVVKFTQIRAGHNALDTEPIVVHQKLHFIDEDLGRLASLYTLSWGDLKLFEDFLKYSPVALDTFAPNERCISLVRMSKDGKKIAQDHEIPYRNLLEKYDYYHGKTVGIIIRNGDNLYLGWTDSEWIDIEDDLILSKPVVDTEPAPAQQFRSSFEHDRKRWIEEKRKERRKIMEGLASRSFVYNIVQGVVEHTPILPLPEGVSLSKQSEYVYYSIADKWVTDNRYGSFNDIVDRCNSKVSRGDRILTVQNLHPEWKRSFPQVGENSRGRGYANRTHDVSADDCTIYPVNLVEEDPPVSWTRYKMRESDADFHYRIETSDLERLSENCVIGDSYTEQNYHYFISLKKEFSEAGARSNFEVFPSEFINLTYMNSVWIEWAITTKTLGGWSIGGKSVNYAYAIRYMKKALDFIRAREEKEKILLDAIDPAICREPEWPVKLSEWRLEKGVRELTEFQAKRFAKALGS